MRLNCQGFAPPVILIIVLAGIFATLASQNYLASLKNNNTPPTTFIYLEPTPGLSPTSTPTPSPTPKPSIATTPIPSSAPTAPVNNTPPSSGYSKQTVKTDIGEFTVDIIAADMSSTKVIVDTASDSDCSSNCPVLSLADYVNRSGAYAGINGSYFCPKDYASCAGKENSFDTLLMNKNKVYFNSANNIHSTVPAAIFYSGGTRFVAQSLEWGRDTSVDGVIANHPLTLSGGNIVFGGNSDPKQGSKGSRSFVGTGGGKVYIGVVRNATVAESAHVHKALGMQEALNLDSGGSTALYINGYKVGPGRNIPNAVLFVQR
jgi:exopolysaccharide biosynthesis protein